MALLGLDSLGHLAIGQLPPLTTAALPALTGSYAVGGPAGKMSLVELASKAPLAFSGNAAAFASGLPSSAIALNVAALSATFVIPVAAVKGGYTMTSKTVAFATRHLAEPVNYSLVPRPAPLAVSLTADFGGWLVSGIASTIERGYEAWFPRPADRELWAGVGVPEGEWVASTLPVSVWSIDAGRKGSWVPMLVPVGNWTK